MLVRLRSFRVPLAVSVILVVISSLAGWQALRSDETVDPWTADDLEVGTVWADLTQATLDHVNEVLRSGIADRQADTEVTASAARLIDAESTARARLEGKADQFSLGIVDYLDSVSSNRLPPEIFVEFGGLLEINGGSQPAVLDLTRPRLHGELVVNGALAAELIASPAIPPEPWVLALQIPLTNLARNGGLAVDQFNEPATDPLLARDLDALLSASDFAQLRIHNEWLADGAVGERPVALDHVEALAATLDERIEARVAQSVEAAKGDAPGIDVPWALLAILSGAAAVLVIAGVVTGQARRTAELERIAAVDPLTGVANRRSFERRTAELFDRADQPGHLVVALDLDLFKSINDQHGHAVGDLVLKAVADRAEARLADWAATSQATAAIARVGGDEFLVSAHHLGDDAVAAAFELSSALRSINDDPVSHRGRLVNFSTSIGVAVTGERVDLDEMIEHADRALYAAKDAGGGCVRVVAVDIDPEHILSGASKVS